jgi:hypothetical protein
MGAVKDVRVLILVGRGSRALLVAVGVEAEGVARTVASFISTSVGMAGTAGLSLATFNGKGRLNRASA